MKHSILAVAFVVALVAAAPFPQSNCANDDVGNGNDVIAQLQNTFDRNNPNGTPTEPGNPDDLNGDGVINAFEAGAQVSKRQSGNACRANNADTNKAAANNAATGSTATDNDSTTGSSVIEQLQSTFDRNNPNGTPTDPGNPDDLNGDGVINVFEAGAQAGKR